MMSFNQPYSYEPTVVSFAKVETLHFGQGDINVLSSKLGTPPFLNIIPLC